MLNKDIAVNTSTCSANSRNVEMIEEIRKYFMLMPLELLGSKTHICSI